MLRENNMKTGFWFVSMFYVYVSLASVVSGAVLY